MDFLTVFYIIHILWSQATINLTFEDSGPGKPKIPDGIAPRSVFRTVENKFAQKGGEKVRKNVFFAVATDPLR
jgi:hypothetical protein